MRRLVAMCLVTLVACGGDERTDSSRQPPSAAASSKAPDPRPTGKLSAAVVELMRAVPSDAFAVAFIDSPRSFWEYLSTMMPVPLPPAQQKALDAELTKLLADRIGINPSRAKAVVGFARPGGREPTGAVLIGGVTGDLKGAKSGADASLVVVDRSEKIVAAKKGDIVILGPEDGVRAAFETIAGKRRSLPASKPGFWSWMQREAGGAFLAVAGTGEGTDDPRIRGVVEQVGAERALVTVSRGGVRALATGDKNKLKRSAGELLRALRDQLAKSERLKAQSTSPDAPLSAAIGGILQYHLLQGVRVYLEPKTTADGLEIAVPARFGDGSMTLALLGMASAVAIPAFLKYTKMSKNSEALMQLGIIHAGVEQHYLQHQTLPPSAPMTPPAGSCCRGAAGRCMPDARLWEQPGWQALRFAVDRPHLYSYEYRASGQTFTIRAVGDLDCDGEYGTFEMHGMVDASGAVTGGSNIMRINELE